jgi:hypothetical protein
MISTPLIPTPAASARFLPASSIRSPASLVTPTAGVSSAAGAVHAVHAAGAVHAVHAAGAVHVVHAAHAVLTATSNLQLTPDTGALPGGDVLQKLMNGLDGWALALSLVGLVVGAAAWALGAHGQNYQQSYVGRRAVLISGFAALLIGAGPGIVNFFFNTGQGVH